MSCRISPFVLIRKAQAPISAPSGKWGIARRQLLSHRSDFTFDPEGQGAVARQIVYFLYLLRKAQAPYYCVRLAAYVRQIPSKKFILSHLIKKERVLPSLKTKFHINFRLKIFD